MPNRKRARSRTPAGRKGHAGAGTIRILLADDQAMDRAGLRKLLEAEPDFRVVGEARSGAEAVELCRSLRPDVIILDTRMPELDGVTAIPLVRAASPGTRIIAVAEHGEARCLVLNPPRPGAKWDLSDGGACTHVTDCLQLAVTQGALGAIRRSAEPEQLYRAVRAVAAGNAWYELGTASRLLERALGLNPVQEVRTLSSRERQVAAMIADGRSNKEIASAMGISDRTVKKHVSNILDKLRLQDRLQLGVFVARNPLLLSAARAPRH